MTDAISSVQNEQKRQSEELGAMRSMHIDLMRGVSDMVAKLGILDAQYKEAAKRETEMRAEIRGLAEKVEALRVSQASNEYVISLVKAANRNILLAALGAVGTGVMATFAYLKV